MSQRRLHQYVDVETTIGATSTVFLDANAYALPSGSATTVLADITGRDTTSGDAVTVSVRGCVKNVGGTVTVSGTTATNTIGDASIAGTVGGLQITGSTIEVIATGVAGKTIEWTAWVRYVVE